MSVRGCAIISSDYKTRGSLGLLSFVLGASDYDDFVSRVYYVERITLQNVLGILVLFAGIWLVNREGETG